MESLFRALPEVIRLADPIPDPSFPTRWWPPAMIDAEWVHRHRDDFDVMHVHFGLESLPAGRLLGALDALDAVGRPLVFTVHDLENPNLDVQTAHLRDLDEIIPRADAILTLTGTAAAEITQRWGRTALVAPHPAITSVGASTPRGRLSAERIVGMHLRDVRPNIDAIGAARTLLGALDLLAANGTPVRGRITVHDRVRDARARDAVLALVADRADVDVEVVSRPSDAALEAELAGLDVEILPYRHGTHSGWVELCYDLAVPVVGTSAGHMSDQHPDDFESYSLGDSASLASAIDRSLASGTRPGTAERGRAIVSHAAHRRRQRQHVADVHLGVYRSAIAARQSMGDTVFAALDGDQQTA
jgi:hypothetical protein